MFTAVFRKVLIAIQLFEKNKTQKSMIRSFFLVKINRMKSILLYYLLKHK